MLLRNEREQKRAGKRKQKRAGKRNRKTRAGRGNIFELIEKIKGIWELATGKKARLVAVRVLTRQVGHQEPAVGAAHQEHLHKQRSR